MEATVSLALLVLVMVVALTLLFQMKAFAERQHFVTQPRQAARRAIDYLTFHVSGAADLNHIQATSPTSASSNNPNAIVCWYSTEANAATQKAACYNDVADPDLADVGTDIVTMAVSENPLRVGVTLGPGGKHDAAGVAVNFSTGCAAGNNMELFKQYTGAGATGNRSSLMTLVDSVGNWQYFQITDYTSNDCTVLASGGSNVIIVRSDSSAPGVFTGVAPNGEPALVAPVVLASGVQFVSFRVRNGNLEQKLGIFDASTDNPGTDFVPIVENVVDLQVAYIYPNGVIWNDSTNSLLAAGFAQGVPPQAGPCRGTTVAGCSVSAPLPDALGRDVQNVIGLRISVVARSPQLTLSARSLAAGQTAYSSPNHIRPAVEDHAAGPAPALNEPLHEFYRLTTTLMLRNRVLGS